MMSAPKQSLGHVLVTGGCGFLGHHIVSLLLELHPSTKISVLDLRTTHNRNPSPNVSYHDGDITDADAMTKLFLQLKPDVVIHTASPHFTGSNPILFKVNVDGTKCLLKVSQESGVKAFVYTSSASVINTATASLINADERWPIIAGDEQPEYYTSTKAWAEIAVLEANRKSDSFLTTAIRPAGIFGEGDVQLLPPIISAYKKGQTKFQIGENLNLFDFTYVKNVAYGHILAANALLHTHAMLPQTPEEYERVDGEAFIITNGEPCYFWDFARTIWRECGDKLPLSSVWKLSKGMLYPACALLESVFWIAGKKPNITRQQVKYSTAERYFNIDKAKRRLGYKPLYPLEEGIIKGVKAYFEEEKRNGEKKSQ